MGNVEIDNEQGISLHVETIHNELGQVACKKPYANKINRGKRIKFGKEMLEKSVRMFFGLTSRMVK